MKLTFSIDDDVAERAGAFAHAMGKSLEQLVGEYVEQLADADQAARDVEEWRRLSRETRDRWAEEWDRLSRESHGDSKGWKFNREEIHDRYDRARRACAANSATTDDAFRFSLRSWDALTVEAGGRLRPPL